MNEQRAIEILKENHSGASARMLDNAISNPEYANIQLMDCKAFLMGIAALEKQIPKKPVRPYESNYKQYWNCPSCGSSGMHDVYKYCWKCGQKLEWEESR